MATEELSNKRGELTVSISPYIQSTDSITKVMADVLLALLPAVGAAVYYFRYGAITVIATAVISAVLIEFIWQKALKQEPKIKDLSAIVTGLLLALTLPPALPLWMVVSGVFVSIIFGKQVFGGLGHNPFNPALVGRAFLQISWPQAMNTWYSPVDAVSCATPLSISKLGLPGDMPSYMDLLMGNRSGSLGETSVIALLLGGLFLIYRKQVFAITPLVFISVVALGAYAFGQDILFHVMSGGLFLGAFFMATDPVTSPVSKWGKFVFAFGCGLLTILIRLKGGFPEGVCFSILIMNMTVPLLDKFTVPAPFGGRVKK